MLIGSSEKSNLLICIFITSSSFMNLMAWGKSVIHFDAKTWSISQNLLSLWRVLEGDMYSTSLQSSPNPSSDMWSCSHLVKHRYKTGKLHNLLLRQYAGHLAGVINTNYISLLIAYNRQRRGVVMFQLFIQHYSPSIQNTDQPFCPPALPLHSDTGSTGPKSLCLNTLVNILKIQTIQYPSSCTVTLLLIIMSADYN